MFSAGVVALAGSRFLPAGGVRLVASVVKELVASGFQLVCGCATGADAVVISSAPPQALRVFAVFGLSGSGSAGSVSAVSVVRQFAAAGGSVEWWSGGYGERPLRVRLAARTRAVVSVATAGLVVFPASLSARGSWLAARLASRGLPVVAFPLALPPSALSSLGAGRWVACGGPGVWASAWCWLSGQDKLTD